MKSVSITLDIYNIFIGIILLFSIYTSHYMLNKLRKWFNFMVVLNTLMSAADIFTLVFEGPSRAANFIILPIAMFAFYSMS